MSDIVRLFKTDGQLYAGVPAPGPGRRAILFVHGGRGDPRSTWTGAHNTYWPALVSGDPAFGNPDVLSVGYDTAAKGWTPDVRQIARELGDALAGHGFEQYDAITFVVHSLGAIVARWLLCNDVLRNQRKFWPKTRLVMSYSGPYQGCEGAKLAAYLLVESEQIKSVVPPSPMLDALAAEWQSVLGQPGPRPAIRCAWEDPPVKGDWFMGKQTATFQCDEPCTAIHENHSNIVKPDGLQHPSHVLLREAYQAAVLGH